MRRPSLPFAARLVVALLALAPSTTTALAQTVSTFASSQVDVYGLAFNSTGTLYVGRRTTSNVIMKCTPPSNAMSLFASGGFADPTAMVCDAAGNLFVADYDYGGPSGAVMKVTPGGVRSTFAVVPNPVSITIDASGNLYVGRWDRVINKITPAGVVSIYADLNTVSYLGVSSLNNHVSSLVLDTDGTLYASVSWGAIFKIGPGGSPIAGFNRVMLECFGLTMGGDGYLYGTSYTHNEVWKIAFDGTGTLFAGRHDTPGFVNGPALTARFNDPAAMAVRDGVLYIADYSNSAVRAVNLDGTSPARRDSWGRLKALYR